MNLLKKARHNYYRFETLVAKQYRESKLTFFVYMTLRLLVTAVLIISIIRGRYENITMCVIALILFTIPPIFERTLNADFPTVFEIVILMFVFSAQILGELACFYIKFSFWDTMLHTIGGFVFAAFGFSLIDLLHKDNQMKFKLSPIYLAISSFSFSIMLSVLWEFFECGMDYYFGADMQKDTIVKNFQSVMLDPTNKNIPVKVTNINNVIIDGTPLPFSGYLDIGLLDTMKDLAVCALGALVFGIIAYQYVKTGGKNKIAAMFVPVYRNWKTNPPTSDVEAELNARIAKLEKELEINRFEKNNKNFKDEKKLKKKNKK